MNRALFPDLVINGELVPHVIVAAETQNQEAPKDKPGIAWRKAVTAVAIRTLLLQKARTLGITPDCHEVGPGRFETEDEAQIRSLLEQVVDVNLPDDDDIKAEWYKDPTRFRSPPLWEVSHILCACDPRDDAGRGRAFKRAETVAAALQKDPSGFAGIVARVSDCGSKSSGGALGQLGPGDTVPEFETALRTLRKGTITPEPVLTRYGYHLIRMDAVAMGEVLPFKAVRERISDALEKAAWARQAQVFVQQLVDVAVIEGATLKTL